MYLKGFALNFVQKGDTVVINDNNIPRKGVVLCLKPGVFMGVKEERVFVMLEDGREVSAWLHLVRRLSTTGLNNAPQIPPQRV